MPVWLLPLMMGMGVGGGMGAAGGKKGGGGGDTAAMSRESFDMSQPAMQKSVDMFLNAANTGGVESRQPVYSQAAEKSLQASSQAQKKLGEELTRTGLEGTPFAERAQREIEQTSQLNAARIPMEMENADYWKILTGMGPAATGGMSTGIQGMGVAEGIEAQQFVAMSQLMQQLMGTTVGAFGSGDMSAIEGMLKVGA